MVRYQEVLICLVRWLLKDKKYIDMKLGLNFTAVMKKIRRIVKQYSNLIQNGRKRRNETRIKAWRLMIGDVYIYFANELQYIQNEDQCQRRNDKRLFRGFLPFDNFTYCQFPSYCDEFDHFISSNRISDNCVRCGEFAWRNGFCYNCHTRSYIHHINQDDIIGVISLMDDNWIKVKETEYSKNKRWVVGFYESEPFDCFEGDEIIEAAERYYEKCYQRKSKKEYYM